MEAQPLVIGVDIGGTHTKIGLVNPKGACLASSRFDTPRTDFKDFLHTLKKNVDELSPQVSAHTVVGLSVGAPSVNSLSQCVISPPNLPWPEQTPLLEELKALFGLPVLLLNDADAAALGELRYGKAQGLKDFAYITLGTGLGSSFVVQGRLLEGAYGVAAELGHVCFRKGGRRCRCGKRGCLETYVSARGLKRTLLQVWGEESIHTAMTSKKIDKLKTKTIVAAAQGGDPIAKQALSQTGTWLGEALANVLNVTGSAAVFVAGGLAKSASLFLPVAQESMNAALLPALRGKIRLEASSLLDNNPAILGSAHHFFSTQKI